MRKELKQQRIALARTKVNMSCNLCIRVTVIRNVLFPKRERVFHRDIQTPSVQEEDFCLHSPSLKVHRT